MAIFGQQKSRTLGEETESYTGGQSWQGTYGQKQSPGTYRHDRFGPAKLEPVARHYQPRQTCKQN